MPKRIVVCFDGTWNEPDDDTDVAKQAETNVRRLYESVRPRGADGREQEKWYDEGVGTKFLERLRGGLFGLGLSENIRQGYRVLIDTYQEGDEVFVFGFSRGAYTARSLVGLIRKSGLVRRDQGGRVEDAYELYRRYRPRNAALLPALA